MRFNVANESSNINKIEYCACPLSTDQIYFNVKNFEGKNRPSKFEIRRRGFHNSFDRLLIQKSSPRMSSKKV